MNHKSVDWPLALSVWWSAVWRGFVVSVVAGAVLGGIGGFVVGLMGRADLGAVVGGALGWLASIPVSLWAMKSALSRPHKGFDLVFARPGQHSEEIDAAQ